MTRLLLPTLCAAIAVIILKPAFAFSEHDTLAQPDSRLTHMQKVNIELVGTDQIVPGQANE